MRLFIFFNDLITRVIDLRFYEEDIDQRRCGYGLIGQFVNKYLLGNSAAVVKIDSFAFRETTTTYVEPSVDRISSHS